jgi:hypothetical protein
VRALRPSFETLASQAPQDEVRISSQARKQAIQYSRALVMKSKSRGVLDTPLEPVIGLAEGETRWRGMTALSEEKDQ